jgi:hypothetical protein
MPFQDDHPGRGGPVTRAVRVSSSMLDLGPVRDSKTESCQRTASVLRWIYQTTPQNVPSVM